MQDFVFFSANSISDIWEERLVGGMESVVMKNAEQEC